MISFGTIDGVRQKLKAVEPMVAKFEFAILMTIEKKGILRNCFFLYASKCTIRAGHRLNQNWLSLRKEKKLHHYVTFESQHCEQSMCGFWTIGKIRWVYVALSTKQLKTLTNFVCRTSPLFGDHFQVRIRAGVFQCNQRYDSLVILTRCIMILIFICRSMLVYQLVQYMIYYKYPDISWNSMGYQMCCDKRKVLELPHAYITLLNQVWR